MTNAELILINEISKIPKSKDAKFFIELEHLDKHCYIPNHIPIYEDDFYNSILRVPGNMFKYDMNLSSNQLVTEMINGIACSISISFRLKPNERKHKMMIYEANKIQYPANLPIDKILKLIPDYQLIGHFICHYTDKDIHSVDFLGNTPTLMAISSVYYSIAMAQSGHSSGRLEIQFNHNAKSEDMPEIQNLISYLSGVKDTCPFSTPYPYLLVNKNVKPDKLYTHADFQLQKY